MEGFRIIIDRNNMFVKLLSTNDEIDLIYSEEELIKFLKHNLIIKGINRKEALRAFVELNELITPTEYIVASGKWPVHGSDGKIKFHLDMSDKAQYFAPEEDDDISSVDYKSAIGTPVAKAGELICEITPPTQGIDGYNIYGKLLPASDGKKAKITLGPGFKYDTSMTKIYAESGGRPEFKDNRLIISSIYEINGDVCFETGNIDFDGHVVVHGSVLDEFSINAKSIEVKGYVGNSFIKTEKDLIVYGGINGKNSESMNSGCIECGGNLLVKYLNDSNIEAAGDVTVRKEIVNSEVKSFGKVKAHCIIGGSTTALKGVEADIIGSELGTPTIIEAGVNYRVKHFDEALANLSWQIDSLLIPIKNYLGDDDYFKRITARNQERFILEYNNFLSIREGYLQLLGKKDAVSKAIEMTPNSKVIVFKHLFTDVLVLTTTCSKKFMYEFKGPIVLLENLPLKSIKIANYTKEDEQDDILSLELLENIKKYTPNKNVFKIKLNGLNKIIYTKEGLDNIKNKFYQTIYGQNFTVCIFEDRHIKRVTLENSLKKAGIKNIHGVKDAFEALEIVKELEEKNLIVICNLHIGQKEGLEFVSSLLHKAPNNYGIFLADKVTKPLFNAISKIKSLAIFHESTEVNNIVHQIKNFGFDF